MEVTEVTTEPQLHICYDGGSVDVPLSTVDLGDESTEDEIRSAAADHIGVPASKFSSYGIHPNRATGDITLAPQAILG
jgi:hypothetical protein